VTIQPTLTPATFAAKWKGVETTEKASAQSRFARATICPAAWLVLVGLNLWVQAILDRLGLTGPFWRLG